MCFIKYRVEREAFVGKNAVHDFFFKILMFVKEP